MSHLTCTFCSKNSKDNKQLNFLKEQQSENIICGSCVTDLNIALEQIISLQSSLEGGPKKSLQILKESIPDPAKTYDFLCQHIIGNNEAKIKMSIALSNHYKRMIDPTIKKSNILLIGPTGTGKTEIGRTLSSFLDVPFLTVDATSFTGKGFVGESVESIIERLLIQCNWDTEKAGSAIILIDEIDKIGQRGNSGTDNSVNTTSVQMELLKILEGDKIKVSKRSPSNPMLEETFFVDTSNILFICAGAFSGLKEKIVKSSKNTKIGLGNDKKESVNNEVYWADTIETKHLTDSGLIPEFLGRLPVIATTNELKEEDLVKIITEPKNSISEQFSNLFKLDEVNVEFSDEFIHTVAKEAMNSKLGARGLRTVFEKRLEEAFFNIKEYKNKSIRFTNSKCIEIVNKNQES